MHLVLFMRALDQHSMSRDEGGRRPVHLGRTICCKNFQAQNHPDTSAVCCDRPRGSQFARKIEKQKDRLTHNACTYVPLNINKSKRFKKSYV